MPHFVSLKDKIAFESCSKFCCTILKLTPFESLIGSITLAFSSIKYLTFTALLSSKLLPHSGDVPPTQLKKAK
jgi:hypothetical protein